MAEFSLRDRSVKILMWIQVPANLFSSSVNALGERCKHFAEGCRRHHQALACTKLHLLWSRLCAVINNSNNLRACSHIQSSGSVPSVFLQKTSQRESDGTANLLLISWNQHCLFLPQECPTWTLGALKTVCPVWQEHCMLCCNGHCVYYSVRWTPHRGLL